MSVARPILSECTSYNLSSSPKCLMVCLKVFLRWYGFKFPPSLNIKNCSFSLVLSLLICMYLIAHLNGQKKPDGISFVIMVFEL